MCIIVGIRYLLVRYRYGGGGGDGGDGRAVSETSTGTGHRAPATGYRLPVSITYLTIADNIYSYLHKG